MASEKDMEDAICRNPEKYLGEPGLKLIARQYRIGSYIFDLLFEDRHGAKVIVEIQKGTLDRNHLYKILDYYDEYKEENPNSIIELMVIANQITYERRKRLDSKGISWKEIPESEFQEQLNNNKDNISLPEQLSTNKNIRKSLAVKAGTDIFGRQINSNVGRIDVHIEALIKADKLEDITVDNLYKLCSGKYNRSYINTHLKSLCSEKDVLKGRFKTMERVVEELTGDRSKVARIPNCNK